MVADLLVVLALLALAVPRARRQADWGPRLAELRRALLPWPFPGLSALLVLAIALGWLRIGLLTPSSAPPPGAVRPTAEDARSAACHAVQLGALHQAERAARVAATQGEDPALARARVLAEERPRCPFGGTIAVAGVGLRCSLHGAPEPAP